MYHALTNRYRSGVRTTLPRCAEHHEVISGLSAASGRGSWKWLSLAPVGDVEEEHPAGVSDPCCDRRAAGADRLVDEADDLAIPAERRECQKSTATSPPPGPSVSVLSS